MTTLATCWKVTRRDTTVQGFTDHDADLTISGVTYKSAVGFVPSSIDRSTEITADTQQLVGIINSTDLSADDLRAGIYTGARVEIFQANWSTSAKVRTLLVGHLGEVQITGQQYSAVLLSLEHELSKPAVRIASTRCDADLGDTRCGYSLVADNGTVTGVTSARRVFVDTGLAADDGYYDGGKVTWVTGDNAGRVMDVKKYTSSTDTVELYEPLPDDIAIADTYTISRGCDKTMATCIGTYSNGENFRGFPHIPGFSDLIGSGT